MDTNKNAVIRELLPFTIEAAKDGAALAAAVQIRQSAYARHLPDVARAMHAPEAWDAREGTVVLVARSKLDGTPVGTMRIHTNEHAPLPLEQSYALPGEMTKLRLAEATRLGVAGDRVGPVVTTALLKAFYLYCVANDIDHMVITARHPVDRMYERLLFKDVGATAGYVPMAHVGGLPHRVLQFPVKQGRSIWKAVEHPLYRYMAETEHPDIKVTPAGAHRQAASNEAPSAATA